MVRPARAECSDGVEALTGDVGQVSAAGRALRSALLETRPRTPDLAALVAPGHAALVTVEVQNMVVGEHSVLPALAAAVASGGVIENIGSLARAARTAEVPVIHCTAETRADGLGGNRNARLFAAARKLGGDRSPPPGAFDLHPGVGAGPGDLVLPRLHGVSPMTGTSLDPILRNLGVSTIVATGVSVNIALLGLSFEAVNFGYQLVIPRDATAGVDERYVDAVYEHTLSLVATVTTTAHVVAGWQAAA